ncbi:hypothetical protein TNCV_3302481 [Trichonephila clavipes]|nr:hypothetical protein TNCV_3302481 [Trichonephila clavipes]
MPKRLTEVLRRKGYPAQVSSTSLDHGSKLRGPSPKALVQLNSATLIFNQSTDVSKNIKPDEIGNLTEEVDLARQINPDVDSDDVQELLDSHNQEPTVHELRNA